MTKQSARILVSILSTLASVLCCLIMISVFCALAFVILNFGFKTKNSSVYMFVWMFCFLLGMTAGVLIYMNVMKLIINKTKLKDLLN